MLNVRVKEGDSPGSPRIDETRASGLRIGLFVGGYRVECYSDLFANRLELWP